MRNSIINKILFTFFLFFNFKVFAINLIIDGNQFTDESIVVSIIDDIPDIDNQSKSNYILKKLLNINL